MNIQCDHFIGYDEPIYAADLIRESDLEEPEVPFNYCPKCGKELKKSHE